MNPFTAQIIKDNCLNLSYVDPDKEAGVISAYVVEAHHYFLGTVARTKDGWTWALATSPLAPYLSNWTLADKRYPTRSEALAMMALMANMLCAKAMFEKRF